MGHYHRVGYNNLVQLQAVAQSSYAIDLVWTAIADINAWPSQCKYISVAHMETPLAVGAKVRLVMTGMRPATWTVTQVREQDELVLETTGPGFVIQAKYAVVDDEDDAVADRDADPGAACTVRLSQTITGPMAWAVTLMVRRQARILLREHARSLASPTTNRHDQK